MIVKEFAETQDTQGTKEVEKALYKISMILNLTAVTSTFSGLEWIHGARLITNIFASCLQHSNLNS